MKRSAPLMFVFFAALLVGSVCAAEVGPDDIIDVSVESVSVEPVVIQPSKPEKQAMRWQSGDSTLEVATRFRIESFFGRGLQDFQLSPLDETVIPAKHTIDFAISYALGKPTFDFDIFKIKSTIRTRGTWGAPDTIASTGPTALKDLDYLFDVHTHPINRFILWMRELWMEIAFPGLFNSSYSDAHTFTLGFFPFELGRGIALGSAYATDPDLLGYAPAVGVDQYAPGFKFTGRLACDELRYDVYAGLLRNKSDTFTNVNQETQGQEYGQRCHPQRGFGVIDYVIAGRLKWKPLDEKETKVYLEPYALYDRQAEQRIEFLGDASSKLGTIGLAFNSAHSGWSFDFEIAKNIGVQSVKGWDRNVISKENRNGVATFVNSQVTAIATVSPDVAGQKAVVIPANQTIINGSPQNEIFNSQQIGDSNLQNSKDRFSNPYKNKLTGFMFVTDLAYRFDKNLRFAVEFGYASGDQNPNRDINELGDSNKDGNFKGFISLQEVYSGSLIKSAFLLNGSGKVPRISNFGSSSVSDSTANTVSRFTNIMYVGPSIDIKGKLLDKAWTVMPNIISYWQTFPLKIFDQATGTSGSRNARSWYGLELNTFADIMLAEDFKLFFVGAVFIPGSYYSDIAGKPITKAQQKAVQRLSKDGVPGDFVLFSGTSTAFFMNLGIEYRF